MRTIHADLKTAQEANETPYIVISIDDVDGAGAVDYGTGNATNPLISYEWIEEPYRDRAIIVIGNSNRGLDPGTLDLRGSSFSIGTGYNCSGDVNRYLGDGLVGGYNPAAPTLWVKSQHITSIEGKSVCILLCEGMWMKLRELRYLLKGEAPYYDVPFGGTQTIKEMIVIFLAGAGMTLNASFGDDSIVNDFKPWFTINTPPFESLASLLYRLIVMTKDYLRQEASLVFKLIYPQDADSVDETYYSDKAPYFKEYTEKKNLLIPNEVIVYWGYNADTEEWDTSALANPGLATDAASIAAYTTVRHSFIAPRIASKADADNRASAIMTRNKAEILAGRLILPYHDCSVELYDRVEIQDKRGRE